MYINVYKYTRIVPPTIGGETKKSENDEKQYFYLERA